MDGQKDPIGESGLGKSANKSKEKDTKKKTPQSSKKWMRRKRFLASFESYLGACWDEADSAEEEGAGGFYIVVYATRDHSTYWMGGRTPKKIRE